MSRKLRFQAGIIGLLPKLGGSHLTREARERTAVKFTEVMFSHGFTHLASPSDITGKHIRVYIDVRTQEGASIRTIQNEMSHLRSFLKASGKPGRAQSPELSNHALGISGGSRLGTKTALTDEELQRVSALAVQQGRPGMKAVLLLERHLGLRGNEAIHARQDTLERWISQVTNTGKITVIAGTKGGRARDVTIHNRAQALLALEFSLSIVKKQAGYLIVRANGKPSGGLKEARSIYHAWANRAEVQPHAARYAFARDQYASYKAIGFSSREAAKAVSLDLGHGDGRGRWIRSVYMK